MPSTTVERSAERSVLWTGRILSALIVLFLLFDALIHVVVPTPVVQAFNQLGVPVGLSVGIGIIELVCVALYVVPRTAVLGAVLLTGYLGGAIAIQWRAGAPVFPLIFPVLVGAVVWGGLMLRDQSLRSFFFRGRTASVLRP